MLFTHLVEVYLLNLKIQCKNQFYNNNSNSSKFEMTYLSPGMSSMFVRPVQFMSRS